jgi:hypothetical protein
MFFLLSIAIPRANLGNMQEIEILSAHEQIVLLEVLTKMDQIYRGNPIQLIEMSTGNPQSNFHNGEFLKFPIRCFKSPGKFNHYIRKLREILIELNRRYNQKRDVFNRIKKPLRKIALLYVSKAWSKFQNKMLTRLVLKCNYLTFFLVSELNLIPMRLDFLTGQMTSGNSIWRDFHFKL